MTTCTTQSQKAVFVLKKNEYILPHKMKNGQTQQNKKQMAPIRGGNEDRLLNEYEVSFRGDKNVLERDRGGGCTTL